MYTCPNQECTNKSRYSEAWVLGTYSDNTPCNVCRSCSNVLIELEKEASPSTPRIITRGCSGGSQNFAH